MFDDLKALVLFSSGFVFGFMASAVVVWYRALTNKSGYDEWKEILGRENWIDELEQEILQSDRNADE